MIIVDGKETAEHVDENRLYTVGHIVLRQMNGSFVEFRKIEIKELNGTGAVTGGLPRGPPRQRGASHHATCECSIPGEKDRIVAGPRDNEYAS